MVRDGIIGFAVGDALGVPGEFKSRVHLKDNPITEMIGFGTHPVPKGTWSDDTSMMIATMDSIIKSKGISYNDMALRFCDWAERNKYTATGQVFDIGTTTWDSLMRYSNSLKPAIECGATNFYENGNGSLMRILPLAYYLHKYDKNIMPTINNVSSITHAHEVSVLGCVLYVRYAIFLMMGIESNTAYDMLRTCNYESIFSQGAIKEYERILTGNIKCLSLEDIRSTGYVVHTLESVIYSFLNNKGYKDSVLAAINLGGDTDTIGALTGGLSGIYYGYDNIPISWIESLAKKDYLLYMSDEFSSYLNSI